MLLSIQILFFHFNLIGSQNISLAPCHAIFQELGAESAVLICISGTLIFEAGFWSEFQVSSFVGASDYFLTILDS